MKVGIDWGGTKIEGIVLEPSTGKELLRKRVDAPKDNYEEIINKVCELINDISDNFDDFSVGIGMPGSLHPETGLVQVSNTKALEGQNVKNDLEKKLGYEVKIANDADCLAVSESIDGSGMNYDSVFAVIMGTGVGAGYTFRNQLVVGPNKLTGEWGQNPIPGPMDDYEKSVKRHCGRVGAIEVFLSGPGLENFYSFITNESKTSKDIVDEYAGVRPLVFNSNTKNISKISRDSAIELNQSLINIFGGKWTSGLSLGHKVSNMIETNSD